MKLENHLPDQARARVLVAAAHADDEVIGCGGTLARHAAKGDAVHVVFLADGVSARCPADRASVLQKLRERKEAAAAAHRILGIQGAQYLGFPDNRLDSLPLLDIVRALESILEKLAPDVIYTHHHGDLNIDHHITHKAVLTACRPQPGMRVREIYAFEVISSTEWNTPGIEPFAPQCHVDITPWLDKKMAALEAYQMEMRKAPHSRSPEHIGALAAHRGMCVGVAAAEAFMVTRICRYAKDER
ncbi:MAG: PIG-L family deacetylase [Zoogloeaceae bacterium]|jgi:LmbE family N-acetylglucosaminyl deacetylase|nr:PIG-L family deacetylase [Zoogloeaceae bacterium]